MNRSDERPTLRIPPGARPVTPVPAELAKVELSHLRHEIRRRDARIATLEARVRELELLAGVDR